MGNCRPVAAACLHTPGRKRLATQSGGHQEQHCCCLVQLYPCLARRTRRIQSIPQIRRGVSYRQVFEELEGISVCSPFAVQESVMNATLVAARLIPWISACLISTGPPCSFPNPDVIPMDILNNGDAIILSFLTSVMGCISRTIESAYRVYPSNRIVCTVTVRLPGLLHHRIHTDELARLRVVVAPYPVVAGGPVTRVPTASLVTAGEGTAGATAPTMPRLTSRRDPSCLLRRASWCLGGSRQARRLRSGRPGN